MDMPSKEYEKRQLRSRQCTVKHYVLVVSLLFIVWICYVEFLCIKYNNKVLNATIKLSSKLGNRSHHVESSQEDDDKMLQNLQRHVHLVQQSIWHVLFSPNSIAASKPDEMHTEVTILQLKLQRLANEIEELQKASKINHTLYIEAAENILQRRLTKLQNPKDCEEAKNLVCNMDTPAGLGSEMHLLAECMFIALGTGRTLFVSLRRVGYTTLPAIFPLLTPQKCSFPYNIPHVAWKGKSSKERSNISKYKTVYISAFTEGRYDTNFTPFAIPQSILDVLQSHHEDPLVWWVGQIMKYVTKICTKYASAIERTKRQLGFSHPIVGVHVRRTDKIVGKEAQFHNLTEYMRRVSDWYDRYEMKTDQNITRRVYLATDSHNVTKDAKKRYPDYVFLHLPRNQSQIPQVTRFKHSSLVAEITDIYILSKCDYFVGTFSSNVGRLVYELMQANGDRTFDAVSLDQVYHYHRGYHMWAETVIEHVPRNKGEIKLSVGDIVHINVTKSTQYLGYGENSFSREVGYFPMPKVRRKPLVAHYPGL